MSELITNLIKFLVLFPAPFYMSLINTALLMIIISQLTKLKDKIR